MREKICIACGMPLREAADYPGGDTAKDYCRYCAREDGSMQSYEEKKAGMTDFVMRTQGFARGAAEAWAAEAMAKLPAWRTGPEGRRG